MDVVINVLSVIYVLVLGVQLQGYLAHRRKGQEVESSLDGFEYTGAGEGEASFS